MQFSISVVMFAAIFVATTTTTLIAFIPTYNVGRDGVDDTVVLLRRNVVSRVELGVRMFLSPAADVVNTIVEQGKQNIDIAQTLGARNPNVADRIRMFRFLCGMLRDLDGITTQISLYDYGAPDSIDPFHRATGHSCYHTLGYPAVCAIDPMNVSNAWCHRWNMTTMDFVTPGVPGYDSIRFSWNSKASDASGRQILGDRFDSLEHRWNPVTAGFNTIRMHAKANWVDVRGNTSSIRIVIEPRVLNQRLFASLDLTPNSRVMLIEASSSRIFGMSWNPRAGEPTAQVRNSSLPEEERFTFLYPSTQGDPMITRVTAELGGDAAYAALPVDHSATLFSGKDRVYLDVKRYTDAYGLDVLIVVAMPEQDFVGTIEDQQLITIIVLVVVIVVMLALAVLFSLRLAKPLDELGYRMHLTATLQEDDPEAMPPSILSEISRIQHEYVAMKTKLACVKTFLPQGIMAAEDGPSLSEYKNPLVDDLGASLTIAPSATGVDSTRLTQQVVNEYQVRDCVVLIVTCAYAERIGSPEFATLAGHLLDAVVAAANRYRGVIESMRPHQVIVSFGARRHINNPAHCAFRMATALAGAGLSPHIEWSTLIDRGLNYVGTCGTNQFRQESLVSDDLEVLVSAGLLVHSTLRIPIAATGRVAASFTEKCLTFPIDCLHWADGSRVQLLAVVPSTPQSECTAMIAAVKRGFALMYNASYKEARAALKEVARLEESKSDDDLSSVQHMARRTALRLNAVCRMLTASTAAYTRQYVGWPALEDASLSSAIFPRFDLNRCATSTNTGIEQQLNDLDRIRENRTPKFSEGGDTTAFFELAFTQDDTMPSVNLGASSLSEASPKRTHSQTVGDESYTPGVTHLKRWRRSVKRLGAGSFGTVYRTLHENGSIAAMKIIPLAKATSDIDELRKELVVTAGQRHENLVTFVDAEVTSEEMIVVTELMAGGSLEQLQADFGALPMPVVRRFVIDMLRGLSHLHRAGIIHCDVKPQNVLVGVDGICKLADFGSALHPGMKETGHDPELPMIRGTPAFLAPEVAIGGAPTQASDVWSLGVLVHEMVTGTRPFNTAQSAAMCGSGIGCIRVLGGIAKAAGHDEHDVDGINAAPRPRVPKDTPMEEAVVTFVSSCLRLEPSARPSCDDLLSFELLL